VEVAAAAAAASATEERNNKLVAQKLRGCENVE